MLSKAKPLSYRYYEKEKSFKLFINTPEGKRVAER
jgi:hypothetical protein